LTAWRWRRGALDCEAAFSPTEAGWRQFAGYLAQNPRSAFSLLANVAEEGFHVETIPDLSGADRRKVIGRRLSQAFYGASLTAAASLGHEKGRRKDERLLLAAFTRPAFLRPWLDGIAAADAALSGIFSLPLVAAPLLKELRLPPEPCMLLSVQDQSIRQSFFDKGKLHFSRLTPLPHNGIAQSLAAESFKLQQYLASQRLIGRGQTITAHVLAHPGAFDTIRTNCVDTQAVRFDLLDITECARRVGLKTGLRDSHAETLFLHLLATHPPSVQFAGEDLRHSFRIVQARSWLQGIGALAMAAGLLFSGDALFDARQIARDAEALGAEAASGRQRYGDIVKTFPSVPADEETFKRVIGHYLAEERRSAAPDAFYREISRALEAAPSIEIDRLDWTIGGADAPVPDDAGADIRQAPEDTQGMEDVEDSERLVVRGTLQADAQATARQLLGAFNRFVDALRANPDWRVEVFRQPLDVASGASLRGGDGVREEEKPRDFSLRVTRRIAP
jgi:hypothetical protein